MRVARTMLGLPWIAVGCLILYVLATGGGLRIEPTWRGAIMAALFQGFLATLGGLIPLLAGLAIILTRERFVLDLRTGCLHELLEVAGRVICASTIRLSDLRRIRITTRSGRGGRKFLVECAGPASAVRVSAFHGHDEARAFAAKLGAFFGLPFALPAAAE